MKSNFRKAIVSGTFVCAFGMQLTCLAQSTTSSLDKKPALQGALGATLVQRESVEIAALEAPAKGPAAPASEVAASSTSTEPAGATAPATSSSSATAATPSASLPLKNEAVIKELVEVKKQFAQIEAEMKARMAKL